MKPKFKTALNTVAQVFIGTVMTYGFVFACTVLSVMV